MKTIDIKKVIEKMIMADRSGVISALDSSNIKVSKDIDDKTLFELIMSELESGNPDVILHLGNLITKTFDMTAVEEEMSNAGGLAIPSGGYTGATPDTAKDPSWWSQNKNNIFNSALSIGSSLLGGLFGKKDTPPTTVTPSPGSGDNASQMFMMMQQQQQQQMAAENRRREEEADRRRNNMMIFGVVGGILVVGTIITIIAVKK